MNVVSMARRIADIILSYALASLIAIPFTAILHGEIVGVDVVIAVLVMMLSVAGLQMQIDAIDETLRLTPRTDLG